MSLFSFGVCVCVSGFDVVAKSTSSPAPAVGASTSKGGKSCAGEGVAQAKSNASAKGNVAEEEEEEEDATGIVRGYKKLDDGRVTTYFNRELSEREKALLAATNTGPRKLVDAASSLPTAPTVRLQIEKQQKEKKAQQ